MKDFFLRFYEQLKLYGKTPEFLSLLVILALIAATLIVNVFFLPPFFTVLTVIIFLGAAFMAVVTNLRLAKTSVESKIKTHELKALIQNLKEGVVVYDPNFKILDFNKSAEEIFSVSYEEIIGHYLEPGLVKNPHLKLLTQVIFPSLAPQIEQISGAGAWPQVMIILTDEPKLELYTVLNRILNEKGQLMGFLKLVRDRTREKNIIRSKTEFITVAAHQLRTPLTGIAWAFESLSQVLKDKPDLEKTLEEGSRLSARTLRIVNELLDVSKIEEGKFGYNFEETDIVDFLQKIIEQAKPIIQEYGLKLDFDYPPEKLAATIDSERLALAISNLIDNAIKYNVKQGAISISVAKMEGEPFAKITIKDTGHGIPPEDMKKLFTKFYRGANVVQLEPNGSGLGLYITKNIIKRHGGEIWAESSLGRGSAFCFTIPLDPKLIPQKEIVSEEI